VTTQIACSRAPTSPSYRDVISAINESGIPVNYGDSPPALAGTYSVNGYVTDASYEMYSIVGVPVQSEFVLSQQTNSGKINCEERVGGNKSNWKMKNWKKY